MNTTFFEQSIKSVVKTNGDFKAIFEKVNQTFQNRHIYYVSKTTKIAKFTPLIAVGATFSQAVAVLLLLSLANQVKLTKTVNLPLPKEVSEPAKTGNTATTVDVDQSVVETTTSGISYVPWENRYGPSKYGSVYIGDHRYWFPFLPYPKEKSLYIDENLVGEKITEFDRDYHIETDPEEVDVHVHAVIHSIIGIDSEYGIAVKFDGENGFYWYVTTGIKKGLTVEKVLDKFGFNQFGVYKYMSCSLKNADSGIRTSLYVFNVDDLAKELFQNNSEKENVYDGYHFHNLMDHIVHLQVAFPKLGGVETHVVMFTGDGETRFSIGGNTNYFFFNKEDVLQLKEYIAANGIPWDFGENGGYLE